MFSVYIFFYEFVKKFVPYSDVFQARGHPGINDCQLTAGRIQEHFFLISLFCLESNGQYYVLKC